LAFKYYILTLIYPKVNTILACGWIVDLQEKACLETGSMLTSYWPLQPVQSVEIVDRYIRRETTMARCRLTRSTCVVLIVLGGLLSGATAGGSPAEELTKVMPDNLLFYVATSGSDALKADFDKTTLGRLFNDPNLQAFCKAVFAQLSSKIQQEAKTDQQASKVLDMALQHGRLFLSRPVALGFFDSNTTQGWPVSAFMIVNAANHRQDLQAAMSKIEGMFGEDRFDDCKIGQTRMRGPRSDIGIPFYWGWVQDYLIIAINDSQGAALRYLTRPRTALPEYIKKVPGHGDALVLYLDYARVINKVHEFLIEQAGREDEDIVSKEDAGIFKAVISELGLGNIGFFLFRAGFLGPDMTMDMYLHAPLPRRGIVGAFGPVEPEAFRLVGPRAMQASTLNCNIEAIYDTILNAIKAVPPRQLYEEVQKEVSSIESELNIKIRDGLIKSLAGPMVSYVIPAGTVADAPNGGFVVLLKLSDAGLFEKCMTSIGEFASSNSDGMLQISSQTHGTGCTLHIWACPPLALMQLVPTWAVANGYAVIGSNTPLCKMGIEKVLGTNQKSLIDTEGYRKVAARLPRQTIMSLSYTDCQTQFRQMIREAQQFWPMVVMFANQAGLKLPVVFPSLDRYIADMQPALAYSYADTSGFYSHYQGNAVEQTVLAGGAVAITSGVMLPSLTRAQSQVQQKVAMTKLRQLIITCIVYADEHDGKFPEQLEQLKDLFRDQDVFDSPRRPRDFPGPSYVYVQGHCLRPGYLPATKLVVIYENPAYCSDGVNVAFLDGHVEFLRPQEFLKVLAETYRLLGRQMPEVSFKR